MPTDHDTPTAERRYVGHHFAPFTNLEIRDAEGTMDAAHFVRLLVRQAELPGRDYTHGYGRWHKSVQDGSEAETVKHAADAIREIQDAKHPYAAEIAALIGRIVAHVEALAATRDPQGRYFFVTPFQPGGGRNIGAALRNPTA